MRDLQRYTDSSCRDGLEADPKEGGYLEHNNWIAACTTFFSACTTFSFFMPLHSFAVPKLLLLSGAPRACFVANPFSSGRWISGDGVAVRDGRVTCDAMMP